MTRFARSAVTAVLWPTNTGKTHLAIERLCAHASGLIGFPLRLLAREVYDRVVAIKGPREVALVTGEERIVPEGARWFLATAESMPIGPDSGRDYAFVALDEAQLGAHPERGHVFTDRMLRARGRDETMILGAESLAPMVRALVPEAEIIGRPRFSTLSYAGAAKLSRLPPRSAIIAFSAEQVYALAEMLRRFRGGAAVVMGALSPATRNAQVAMYQAGEVDYLVATDAIGMGLNMQVDHVAFAGLYKYDGARWRRLDVAEMAQIAGRAGRHQRDGTFGSLTGADALFTDAEIARIEEHDFPPLRQLFWRDDAPRFDTIDLLIDDLGAPPEHPLLKPAPEAIDLKVLKRLADDPGIADATRGAAMVRRLWAACSLPDFQQRGPEHHAGFVAQLWQHLGHGSGQIPADLVARRIADLDNVSGDIDKLGGRIAAIRTWAYVAQRRDWLAAPDEMAERARAVEERLSDALHKALAQRFVDRRTAVLMRGLAGDARLLPVTLDDDSTVCVDGEAIGRLEGFRFVVDPDARLADRRLLLAAAERHLPAILGARAAAMDADPDKAFALAADPRGRVRMTWRGAPVATLARGAALLSPRLLPDRGLAALGGGTGDAIVKALEQRLETLVARPLQPLQRIAEAARALDCPAPLRALLVQLVDAGGVLDRVAATAQLAALDPAGRRRLRALGLRIGALDLFAPAMLRPLAQERFALLQALWRDGAAEASTEPVRTLRPVLSARQLSGGHPAYRRAGRQWLRVDLAERVVRAAHEARPKAPPARGDAGFPIAADLAVSIGLAAEDAHALLHSAGFRKAGTRVSEAGPAIQLWRWQPRRHRPRRAASTPAARTPGGAFAALAELDLRLG